MQPFLIPCGGAGLPQRPLRCYNPDQSSDFLLRLARTPVRLFRAFDFCAKSKAGGDTGVIGWVLDRLG